MNSLLSFMLITGIAVCSAHAVAGKQPTISIGSSFLYGSQDGYLQTPAGGRVGTTSNKRPTLDELGFDTVSIYDLHASAEWGQHKILGGVQFIRNSDNAILSSALTSQNRNFTAGDFVKSDVKTDWYRISYLYKLKHPAFLGDSVTVSPGAGIVWFNFHYQLDGGGNSVDRAYSKIGYRLGGELQWQLTNRLSLKTDAYIPIPLSNTPLILSLAARGQYEFWSLRDSSASILAGVAYERIDYEDNQPVPNHIRENMGPLLTAGICFDF